ncbi:aldehyde ferredoxin oxidoreductase family protein [Moorella sp. ACPs]|jgi:aldehyde:ferredoxin oxidoreductase|uniref:aldehyde ferredoxin oxidoreductase family protein n=1 Tax=Neomoorella carbonis TaxID=3062783 RepID=UPI00324EF18E
MLGGYTGKVLRVNLSTRSVAEEHLNEMELRKYIGGVGLAAKVFVEEVPANIDPLSPDNILIFATGPLTGTSVPTSGRHAVVAKSPLTGIWGESDVGGYWGKELKWAGYDMLVITGRASHPVYLLITNDGTRIVDASHLWGKDTYETSEMLEQETVPGAVAAVIGPAGEKQVKLAAIMHDGKHARAAGRAGLGAVMGSKNLKAVVVKGNQPNLIADSRGLHDSIRSKMRQLREGTAFLKRFGTSGSVLGNEKIGDLPIRNWRDGSWPEGALKISGQRLAETYLRGNYRCHSCVIGCGREVKIQDGRFGPVDGAGPEYETVACLGSLCLVDDLEAIVYANELCNRLGLDTISTGAVIAFAMEAFERGLIQEGDTGGVNLGWGNAEAMIELVRQIGNATGLGAILGNGVRVAAEKIGGIAMEYAIHVKGLEFPAHDPRASNSLALTYATSNRGACHLQGFSYTFERAVTMPQLGYPEIQDRFAVEGKGPFTAKLQDLCCMFDSLKLCKFLLFGGIKVDTLVDWLNCVVGWDMDVAEFMLAGERIFNLKRIYNNACGISRKDDILPPRILTQKRKSGGAADNLPPLGKMLSEYYQYRGWDDEGFPTKLKIQELGLEQFVK